MTHPCSSGDVAAASDLEGVGGCGGCCAARDNTAALDVEVETAALEDGSGRSSRAAPYGLAGARTELSAALSAGAAAEVDLRTTGDDDAAGVSTGDAGAGATAGSTAPNIVPGPCGA